MAAVLEDPQVGAGHQAVDLLREFRRADPVVPPGQDQRGRGDAAEFGPQVEVAQEAARTEGAVQRLGLVQGPHPAGGPGGGIVAARIERPHHLVVVPHLLHRAEGTIPEHVADAALFRRAGLLDDPLRPGNEAAMGGGDHQHQVRHRLGIAGRMRLGDHAAIAGADGHDRPQAEMPAQRLHVLDILVEVPALRVLLAGTPLAAMVEIDELHPLRERRVAWLEATVVPARAAMDHHRDRALAHRVAIGHQPHAFHVEIDLGPTDAGAHAASSPGRSAAPA